MQLWLGTAALKHGPLLGHQSIPETKIWFEAQPLTYIKKRIGRKGIAFPQCAAAEPQLALSTLVEQRVALLTDQAASLCRNRGIEFHTGLCCQ